MEFLNQLNEFVQQNLGMGCVHLAIIFLTCYYFASRQYTFYHQSGTLNVTVIRYISGFIPVKKTVYECVSKVEVEEYIDRRDETSTNCARIFLTMRSGKKIELKKLTVEQSLEDINKIASDITSLMNSITQEKRVIHNCRTQSFILLVCTSFFIHTLSPHISGLLGFF